MGQNGGDNLRKIKFLEVKSIPTSFIFPNFYKTNSEEKKALKPAVNRCYGMI